jgi:hypothetical protein
MKHFPARAYPAQIDRLPAAEIAANEIVRASRRQFWIGVLQSLLCGLVGFVAGAVLAAGYLFELSGGWGP